MTAAALAPPRWATSLGHLGVRAVSHDFIAQLVSYATNVAELTREHQKIIGPHGLLQGAGRKTGFPIAACRASADFNPGRYRRQTEFGCRGALVVAKDYVAGLTDARAHVFYKQLMDGQIATGG